MGSETPERGVLVTGYPGFIAGRLVEALQEPMGPAARWFFVVEERFLFVARDRCRALEREHPAFRGRWHVLAGDIRRRDLGITPLALERVRASVRHVWHLAAVYDLAVPQSLAYAVNVDGTLAVLDLCERLPHLERLFYVSTAYVAGDRRGTLYEDELDAGQGFKNHYESTKHWAEKHVQGRRDRIPTVIFRPSIVVGDSRTGETAKGDGPYFLIKLFLDMPGWLPTLHVGKGVAPANLVPVDWLVDAMVQLSLQPEAVGRVFHLADAAPRTEREVFDALAAAAGRAPAVGTLPLRAVASLARRGGLGDRVGVPSASLDYFGEAQQIDVSNTRALLSGCAPPCPDFATYAAKLVDFARANPHILRGGRP